MFVLMDMTVYFMSIFFYKQKTAYAMRISDCSSDVCSSDHAEIAVIFIHLLRQQVDAMKRPFQPLRGADDADIVPNETANLPPVMLDDDFLVAIGDTAFVKCPDRWGKRQAVPVGMDVPGRRFAKDKAFQQRKHGSAHV